MENYKSVEECANILLETVREKEQRCRNQANTFSKMMCDGSAYRKQAENLRLFAEIIEETLGKIKNRE